MNSRFLYRRYEENVLISALPPDKKIRASVMYSVLCKIEQLTFAPYYFGILSIFFLVVLPLFGIQFSNDDTNRILGVIISILLYFVGVFILKKLYFNSRRQQNLDKLERMLAINDGYRHTLDTLRKIDPYLFSRIGKILAKNT